VAGNVDYGLMATILIGSLPGVWLGARWSVRLPVGTLRSGLGVVLIGGGLGMLAKAGADIPTPVLAAAPVALLALFVGHELRQRERPEATVPPPGTATLAQPAVE
jgi:hypothetical protein